jgi:hypothetical protein
MIDDDSAGSRRVDESLFIESDADVIDAGRGSQPKEDKIPGADFLKGNGLADQLLGAHGSRQRDAELAENSLREGRTVDTAPSEASPAVARAEPRTSRFLDALGECGRRRKLRRGGTLFVVAAGSELGPLPDGFAVFGFLV